MFSNTRIGTRLMCLIAIQCLLLLVVGVIGLSGAAHSKEQLHGVYGDSIVPLFYLDTTLNLNFQMRAQLEQALRADRPAVADKCFARAVTLAGEVEKAWEDYTATSMSPEERRLADVAEQANQELVAARDRVRAAFKSGGRAAAIETDLSVQRSLKFDRWREAMDKLVAYQARDAESVLRASRQRE